MKLKSSFKYNKIGEKYLLTSDELFFMITVNEQAFQICKLLEKDISKEELIAALQESYVDKSKIEPNVETVLSTLRQNGLLDE
ncbi:MAG: PqqD family protein [Enterococcus sp.]|nr:PqqD family protein [Enterococcus sp.]